MDWGHGWLVTGNWSVVNSTSSWVETISCVQVLLWARFFPQLKWDMLVFHGCQQLRTSVFWMLRFDRNLLVWTKHPFVVVEHRSLGKGVAFNDDMRLPPCEQQTTWNIKCTLVHKLVQKRDPISSPMFLATLCRYSCDFSKESKRPTWIIFTASASPWEHASTSRWMPHVTGQHWINFSSITHSARCHQGDALVRHRSEFSFYWSSSHFVTSHHGYKSCF